MSMTIEEAMFENLKDSITEMVDIVQDVVSRTRFEELDDAGVQTMNCLDELAEYRKIGLLREFRELKEKATAKRKCPNCNEFLSDEYRFCPTCRRKVDWSEGKE